MVSKDTDTDIDTDTDTHAHTHARTVVQSGFVSGTAPSNGSIGGEDESAGEEADVAVGDVQVAAQLQGLHMQEGALKAALARPSSLSALALSSNNVLPSLPSPHQVQCTN